jgi:hypothetical protein
MPDADASHAVTPQRRHMTHSISTNAADIDQALVSGKRERAAAGAVRSARTHIAGISPGPLGGQPLAGLSHVETELVVWRVESLALAVTHAVESVGSESLEQRILAGPALEVPD